MKKHISQSGSAHAIIMILLVVALIGTLGVVFYQNFIVKKTAAPAVQQMTQPANETARIAYDSDIYELDYPKNWQLISDKSQLIAEQGTLKVANPASTVEVTLTVSQGGVGGACDAADGLKLRYYTVHPTAITKLADAPAYVVEAMTDAPGGGYHYSIGLTREGGETHAALGDPRCTVSHVGLVSGVVIDSAGVVTRPTIIAKITFPKLLKKDETKVKEMQPVKDLLNTDDYKAAVKILESARKQ